MQTIKIDLHTAPVKKYTKSIKDENGGPETLKSL
jgi:hypothetical protein